MKLALIFNPYSYHIHEENLRIVQKFFGRFPPLSLAWVASIAEKHGHKVIIIDAMNLGLSQRQTVDILKDFNPDVLGFTITTYAYQETLSWIKYIKKEIPKPVLIGGFGVALYPIETCTPAEIDFGFIGHTHETLPKFLNELEGNRNFSTVSGLIYKDNAKIKLIPPDNTHFDFDSLPNPARHLLPNEIYSSFPTQRKNFTVMVTSMGCPYKCIFCTNTGTPHCPRSTEVVLREIEECYSRYGIGEIDFFDYEFTIDRQRVIDICNGIISRRLDLLWSCRCRVDSVDKELLLKMRKAGCDRIYFGIESGIQEILDALNKDITLKQILETVNITKETGIKILGFFMIGTPGETKKTVRKTIQFAKSLGLDFVQFSKFTAKPASSLYKKLSKETNTDYWKDYILGKTEAQVLPRPWTTLSQQEIDILVKKAYIYFHSQPLFLLKSVLGIRSFSELKKKFLAYLEMLFCQESISKKAKNFDIYRD